MSLARQTLARGFSAIPRGNTGVCPRRAPPQTPRGPPPRAALMRPDIIQSPPKYFNLMEKKIAIFSTNLLKYTKENSCGSRSALLAFFLFFASYVFLPTRPNVLFFLSPQKNRKGRRGNGGAPDADSIEKPRKKRANAPRGALKPREKKCAPPLEESGRPIRITGINSTCGRPPR